MRGSPRPLRPRCIDSGESATLGLRALFAAATLLAAVTSICLQAAERELWWRTPAVRSAVALTFQQAEELDTIYRASLARRRELRRQFAAQQKRLQEMLSTGVFDDEQARSVVDRLSAIDKERNVARVLMLIRMYRVLTPSQRTKLEHLSVQVPNDRAWPPFGGLLSGKE